jgi:hypothetical protein
MECASASADGLGTSECELHESSDWFEPWAWRCSARERGPKDHNSIHVCKHLWLLALLLM